MWPENVLTFLSSVFNRVPVHPLPVKVSVKENDVFLCRKMKLSCRFFLYRVKLYIILKLTDLSYLNKVLWFSGI